jgi:DnaJ-like protein
MVAAAIYSVVFVSLLGSVLAFAWQGLPLLSIDPASLAGSWNGLVLLLASACLALSITLFLRQFELVKPRYSALEKEVRKREAKGSPTRQGGVLSVSELKAMRVLGVNRRSSSADIRQRYVVLLRKYHPDTNGGDRSGEDKLGKTVRAYRLLCRAGRV